MPGKKSSANLDGVPLKQDTAASTTKFLERRKMLALTSFDIGICTFGALGALLFTGIFGEVSGLLKLVWGLGSIGICLFNATSLIANLFSKFLPVSQIRACIISFCFNLMPAILFVIWHTGKIQIPTPPGCC